MMRISLVITGMLLTTVTVMTYTFMDSTGMGDGRDVGNLLVLQIGGSGNVAVAHNGGVFSNRGAQLKYYKQKGVELTEFHVDSLKSGPIRDALIVSADRMVVRSDKETRKYDLTSHRYSLVCSSDVDRNSNKALVVGGFVIENLVRSGISVNTIDDSCNKTRIDGIAIGDNRLDIDSFDNMIAVSGAERTSIFEISDDGELGAVTDLDEASTTVRFVSGRRVIVGSGSKSRLIDFTSTDNTIVEGELDYQINVDDMTRLAGDHLLIYRTSGIVDIMSVSKDDFSVIRTITTPPGRPTSLNLSSNVLTVSNEYGVHAYKIDDDVVLLASRSFVLSWTRSAILTDGGTIVAADRNSGVILLEDEAIDDSEVATVRAGEPLNLSGEDDLLSLSSTTTTENSTKTREVRIYRERRVVGIEEKYDLISTLEEQTTSMTAILDGLLYLCNDNYCPDIYRIGDSGVVRIGSFNISSDTPNSISLHDERAVFTSRESGAVIIDVSDKSNARLLRVLRTNGRARSAQSNHGALYVADENDGVLLFRDPVGGDESPDMVIPVIKPIEIDISDRIMTVLGGENSDVVTMFDIESEDPIAIGQIGLPCKSRDVYLKNNTILISGEKCGLFKIEVENHDVYLPIAIRPR